MILPPDHIFAEENSLFNTENIRSKLFQRIENKKNASNAEKINIKLLHGVFGRMTDSESIWIRIENRTEFRKWTYKLSKKSLNLSRQEIRVWLKHVSPKQSVSFGKEYNEWFRKKVAFEMGKTFYNRKLTVDYNYSEKLYRLDGMIWSGDTNLNLWMVRNGWSYYLLSDEPPPEHEKLISAEAEAKKKKIGLWKPDLQ